MSQKTKQAISRYRGYVLFAGILLWFLGAGAVIAFLNLVAVGSTMIAVGSSGAYYLYLEYVKQPNIQFGSSIEYSVAPLHHRINPQAKKVIPSVYVRLSVENTGKATAQNCMITVNSQNGVNFITRWAVPENPERYNLLPGETEIVHLFRVPLLSLSKKIIYNPKTGEFIHHGKGREVGLEEISPYPLTSISWSAIQPSPSHPRKMSPESKGKSSYGGWVGKEVGVKSCDIAVQAIAEDYKSEKKDDFETLDLPQKAVEIGSNEQYWQGQWGDEDKKGFFDKATEYKTRILNACKERLRRADEHPI